MSIKGRIEKLEREVNAGAFVIMPIALDDQGQHLDCGLHESGLAAIRYTDGQEEFDVPRRVEEDLPVFEERAAAHAKAHFNATLVGALEDEGI